MTHARMMTRPRRKFSALKLSLKMNFARHCLAPRRQRPRPICQGKTRRENFTRFLVRMGMSGYRVRLRDSPICELRKPQLGPSRGDRVSLPLGIRNDLRKMAVINCSFPSWALIYDVRNFLTSRHSHLCKINVASW